MTYHEFVYDHDLETVCDLMERYAVYHGLKKKRTDNHLPVEENAWEFFA